MTLKTLVTITFWVALLVTQPVPTYSRSLQNQSRQSVAEILDEAAKLQAQGTAESRRQAITKYAEALKLHEAARDGLGEARARIKIGEVRYTLGETAQAAEEFQLAVQRARDVGAQREEADALGNLGVVHLSQGKPRDALAYFERVLTLRRGFNDKAGETTTLTNMASAYLLLGEPQDALAQYTLLLSLQRDSGNRKSEATILTNIGSAHSALGEPARALESYRQVLVISRETNDRAGEASALNNLGFAYNLLGNQALALEHYRSCLPLRESIGDKRGQAITFVNMGSALQELGETSSAIDNLNRGLALMREVRDRRGEAAALVSLGTASTAIGEFAKALSFYQDALANWKAIGDRRREATTLNRLGRLQFLMGDHVAARSSLLSALPLHRRFMDQAGEADSLYQLARVELKEGKSQAAQDAIEQTLQLVESLRSRIFGPRLRIAYFASVGQYYDLYINLLMQRHREEPTKGFNTLALNVNERARARSLVELLSEANADLRRGVPAGLLEEERVLRSRINAKSDRLSFVVPRPTDDPAVDQATKEINQLLTDYQELQSRIRASSPAYASLTQVIPTSLTEIQNGVLDKDTVLLEYRLGEERSHLWLVSANSIRSFELPSRLVLENSARRVYELLTERNKRIRFESPERRTVRLKQADSSYLEAATSLREMVLGPVLRELNGKRLLIVSDGALQYVPFGALPMEVSTRSVRQSQPLIAQNEVVHLPSASVLLTLRKRSAEKPAVQARGLAVFADPVFSKDDPRVRSSQQIKSESSGSSDNAEVLRAFSDVAEGEISIPRLPDTRVEAEAIAALVPRGERTLKALDFDANRRRAADEELASYRIVHFATHGVLNSRHPELSGLLLSMVGEDGTPRDGFLRAHEIYDLSIPAELVVLSGCRTGLGKDVRGEGLIGLTRGFMYAGSPRVAVSLWDVSDAATAELMRRFYRGMLQEKKSPAAALRTAQTSMATHPRWSAPYYWASFVIQGEWK